MCSLPRTTGQLSQAPRGSENFSLEGVLSIAEGLSIPEKRTANASAHHGGLCEPMTCAA